ncbi:hypothetical protein GCM10011403_13090 [Pseudohongiella nitratireducens]|uniref:Flagellar protein FliT n=1 Tax=Pseudohongiella nitratireducens TaxID=1768907 RepID=A0A917GUD4_9GAMM|nr:flagellar protein FliT [Pseudohongiella nitratireducens]MDF1623710.1 flagellar protein FliT [Pseudohongiella nitratireducens]GGG57255.1 hypothetical protein GCM10011403_13090 [Pseudohongiella nitratireducens]
MSESAKNPEKPAPEPAASIQQQWQLIQQMSQQLHNLTRQKAWDQVAALQKKRELALESFFKNDIPAELAAGIAEDVRVMLEQEQAIRDEVQVHQSSLMKESVHLKKLQQRGRSYLAMSQLKRD